MTTYGYIRVSTHEQADGTSPATQEATVRALGATDVFRDEGVSGSVPLADRPAGARLLAALRPGDTVVAAKLDRLFRSALDALDTVEKLKARGVGVILADMGPTPVTENGAAKLFFSMLAAFAEFERDRIRERIANGKVAKRAAGGHTGGTAPFGYRKVGAGKAAMLEPVAEEQAAIGRMKELRSTGLSLRAISAAIRDELGIEVAHTVVERVVKGSAA